jgi:hypothetical protein
VTFVNHEKPAPTVASILGMARFDEVRMKLKLAG